MWGEGVLAPRYERGTAKDAPGDRRVRFGWHWCQPCGARRGRRHRLAKTRRRERRAPFASTEVASQLVHRLPLGTVVHCQVTDGSTLIAGRSLPQRTGRDEPRPPAHAGPSRRVSGFLAPRSVPQSSGAERAERSRALRGAQAAPVGGQEPGQELSDVERDVERGSIGDQCEASGCRSEGARCRR